MTDWKRYNEEMTAADARALLAARGIKCRKLFRSLHFRGWEVSLESGKELMVVDTDKQADAEELMTSVLDALLTQNDVVGARK